MKKKTIAALLVAPIVVSLLTYVTVQVLINQVAADIDGIEIPYRQNEGFQIQDQGYPLEAKAVYDENLIIKDESKNLLWEVSSASDEGVCSVVEQDGSYYLYAQGEGEATLTVRNETGTQTRSFQAHCYEDGVVLINDPAPSSGTSLSSVRRYGQYEIDAGGTKSASTIPLSVEVMIDGQDASYDFECSDNVRFDPQTEELTLLEGGQASLTVVSRVDDSIQATYSFEVVDEGVNVRDYDDLLWCTNRSSEGEVVVLQTSLGSLRDTYLYDLDAEGNPVYRDELRSETMKLFGHYDFQTGEFSFEDEVYTFPSTYPTTFIDQYNEVAETPVSTDLIAGVHVQKDFYGNGFSINLHNLAFPNHGSIGLSGLLTPGEEDLFKGPLALVALGEIGPNALIEAFGQDNCGFFVDGDGIVVDDVRLQNTNNQSNMYDFFYTGSVVDVEGRDNTIRNSVIQNGKNVVRAFSSDGLLIENSILQNGGEFLLYLGNNEYNGVDRNKRIQFQRGGTDYDYDFSSFMDTFYDENDESTYASADRWMQETLMAQDGTSYLSFLSGMQEALDNTDGYRDAAGNVLGTDVTVRDTFFGNSAVYSIAFDTLFNGGYLYNGMPSIVHELLGDMALPPQEVGGTSLPVHLTLEGDVRFYDWKTLDSMDLSGLILQNLSTLMASQGIEADITIDDFFPVKPILNDILTASDAYYRDPESGEDYVSTNVIFYGGGKNLSSVDFATDDPDVSDEIEIDVAQAILSGAYSPSMGEELFDTLLKALSKAVVAVTGTHPFRTYVNGAVTGTPEYFDKMPPLSDLKGGQGR